MDREKEEAGVAAMKKYTKDHRAKRHCDSLAEVKEKLAYVIEHKLTTAGGPSSCHAIMFCLEYQEYKNIMTKGKEQCTAYVRELAKSVESAWNKNESKRSVVTIRGTIMPNPQYVEFYIMKEKREKDRAINHAELYEFTYEWFDFNTSKC